MDPYDTLGIRKDANKAEIHKAYKELLEKYDLNNYPGDPTFAKVRVEKITEAYKILSDSERKLEYDSEHQSHIESHKTEKDVFNPYYKKIYSSKHIHDDMDIAQDKYKSFQKAENIYMANQEQKALKIFLWILAIIFIFIPLFQVVPALIVMLLY